MIQHPIEGKPDRHISQIRLHAFQRRLGGLQIGKGRGELGFRLKPLACQFLGRLVFHFTLNDPGLGFLDPSRPIFLVEDH